MKQFILSGWVALVTALAALAADPIYISDVPVTSPPDPRPVIDATAWVNNSLFDITSINLSGIPLPFETQNTLFFTNTVGGVLRGSPGFRFLNNAGPQRLSMDTWTNNGTISSDSSRS